jgi:uncharacterized membrane protein
MSATDLPGTPPEPMDEGMRLVLPGRSLAAGAGFGWISAGWRLFASAPLMWIVFLIMLFLIALAMNFVPIVGGLAFQLLQGVFAAGFVAGCRSLERGGELELEHFFAGFKNRFGSLLVLGAIVLVGWILVFLVFAAFLGFSILPAILTGSSDAVMESMMASLGTMLIGLLVASLLMVPLMAAYWFAPALIMIHDVPPVAAMKASLSATFRNVLPFLFYGVVMLVLAILAAIPFGLGMLVWIPLMITSAYASYRQIFTEDEPTTEPARAAMAP